MFLQRKNLIKYSTPNHIIKYNYPRKAIKHDILFPGKYSQYASKLHITIRVMEIIIKIGIIHIFNYP